MRDVIIFTVVMNQPGQYIGRNSAEISSVNLPRRNATGMFQRVHKNAENFSLPF